MQNENEKVTFGHVQRPLIDVRADWRTPETPLSSQLPLHLKPILHCVFTHMKLALNTHTQTTHHDDDTTYDIITRKVTSGNQDMAPAVYHAKYTFQWVWYGPDQSLKPRGQ